MGLAIFTCPFGEGTVVREDLKNNIQTSDIVRTSCDPPPANFEHPKSVPISITNEFSPNCHSLFANLAISYTL